jgi:photosystem II stability/assembly factor-like uncharacterized protein
MRCAAVSGSNMYIGIGSNGVMKSADNGVTWQTKSKGFPAPLGINQILKDGSMLYLAANKNSFYKSSDNGNSWEQSSNGAGGVNFQAMMQAGDTIYAGTNSMGFYRSSDKGNSWKRISTSSIDPGNVQGLVRWNGKFYAGLSTTDRMRVSTDGGISWTLANTGLTQNCVGLKLINNRLFYCSLGGLFVLTDTSKAWFQVSTDSIASSRVNTIAAMGSRLYIGTTGLYGAAGAVYYSDDNGIVWRKTKKTPYQDANLLLAGAVSTGIVGNTIIAVTGGYLKTSAVFQSSNAGDTWTDITGNFPATNVVAMIKDLCVVGSDILLPLTDNNSGQYSIYRRTLPTSVNTGGGIVPTVCTLSQNYPNPFNPETTIEFHIPVAGRATLTIFDVLGRKVKTLVDENLAGGTYQQSFSGSGLSSGIYIYQLRAGGNVETKKMTLIQ